MDKGRKIEDVLYLEHSLILFVVGPEIVSLMEFIILGHEVPAHDPGRRRFAQ